MFKTLVRTRRTIINDYTSRNGVSQTTVLLSHLKSGRTITQVVASESYRIHRLASRVYDLKQQGYDIASIPCLDATGTKYNLYRLRGANA